MTLFTSAKTIEQSHFSVRVYKERKSLRRNRMFQVEEKASLFKFKMNVLYIQLGGFEDEYYVI